MFNIFLSRLWTAWCAIAISIVIAMLFPVFAVCVHSGIPFLKRWAHLLVKQGARTVLFLWGIRVKVHHPDVIDQERQYIHVINHRSDLDAVVTLGALAGYWKYLGKAELLKWPVIGYLVRQLYITVDRSDKRSREESLRDMERQARDGASITIFPEGWSNFSHRYVLPLKQGAFHLARVTRLPISVCTIIGTHRLWPKPFVRVRPGVTHFYHEEIIETDGLELDTKAGRQVLKDKVAAVWLRRLKTHYPDGYSYPDGWPDFDTWMQSKLRR